MALTEAHAFELLQQRFDALRDEAPGIHGALLSTDDGHPVLCSAPDLDPTSTAAMVAATLGIGGRLASTLGDPELLEISIRTTAGYLAVFAAGPDTVLTVVTDDSAHLARIARFARLHLDFLAEVVGNVEERS
jgi:predicted regulator of Ras-like GTPase activity (Roadblock/LC7/MglB family)